ncbi:MAG: T9SS type A sorting domain-containing protein [Bacteroidetes bacterium]|nr:T9SS type A sorting domain-containing protein [Bacteroidota bacterium]
MARPPLRLLVVTLLCATFASTSIAQSSDWAWQNPHPLGNTIHALARNGTNLWAAGDAGTVLHSTNNGTTWTVQPTGIQLDLTGISFVDANAGWAVGADNFGGIIINTDDGGASWNEQTPPTSGIWRAVDFVTASAGWIVGDRNILHSADGGATWTEQDPGIDTGATFLTDISFADDQSGWIVGSGGTILHTANAGALWTPQTSGVTVTLNAVFFVDDQNGWAVGNQTIVHTTDGGASWTPQDGGLPTTYSDVHFIDANVGWLATNQKTFEGTSIRTTSDGGATWTPVPTGAVGDIFAVAATDATSAVTAGVGAEIRITSDAGQNWDTATTGSRDPISDVIFFDADFGIAVRAVATTPFAVQPSYPFKTNYDTAPGVASGVLDTGSNAVMTSDGGNNSTDTDKDFACSKLVWKVAKSPGFNNGVTWLGVTCGEKYAEAARVIQSAGKRDGTSSYDLQWVQLDTGADGEILGIAMPDTLHWWVVGAEGLIRASADSGATWTDQTSGTTATLENATFVSSTNGWAYGASGTILHTDNGGQIWSPQTSGKTTTLRSAWFSDANRGWIVGSSGTILHTDNGGLTWTPQSASTNLGFYEITFSNDATGWIVGDNGVTVRSTDGGMSWQVQPRATGNTLTGVSFVDGGHGWAVGVNGTILRYAGPANTATEAPVMAASGTMLRQNYPNPFNAVTTIDVEQPERGRLRLEVFDLLGRKVATLADGDFPKGNHSFRFDGSELAPGIYAYRAVAGKSIASRQMVVIR